MLNKLTSLIGKGRAKFVALGAALCATASAFAEDATAGDDAVTVINTKLDALSTSLSTTQGKVILVSSVIAGIVIARVMIKKFFRI